MRSHLKWPLRSIEWALSRNTVGVAVHISQAFPPPGAYKLSDEGLAATLWSSGSSGSRRNKDCPQQAELEAGPFLGKLYRKAMGHHERAGEAGGGRGEGGFT